MLKIVTAPSNVLAEPTKPVGKIDKEILSFIEEMKQTLKTTHDPEGVGLAAPQVGKSLQLFITQPTPKSKVKVFINPQIEKSQIEQAMVNALKNKRKAVKESTKLEGCLSLPNIWGEVKREPVLTVTYLNEKGIKHTEVFKGFMATIIQHEYDHLQGTLFPKRVLEQKGRLYKSHKDEKNQDVFEEIEI